MRKDVKLGLAVGGVLLAVLVVYVLVVPGNNANQVGATLENLDGSEAHTGGAAADSLAQGEAQPADAAGARAHDQQAKSNGATADAGGASGATASGAGATGAGTVGAAGAGSAAGGAAADAGTGGANTGATAKDSATAGGGWNWDALVNGTEKLPSLGAATDVSTRSTSFANGGQITARGAAASNHARANEVATGNGVPSPTGTSTDNGATPQGGGASDTLPKNAALQSPGRTGSLAGGGGGGQTPAHDAQPAPLTTTNDAARTHVVKSGDTYSKISLAVYGTSKHYADIEVANPGVDPTRLKPGMTINIPTIAKHPTATPAVNSGAAIVDPQKEYKVQPNDSLYTISLRLYGNADRMEKIYELNKAAIGDDMARLKLGMVLKLPEAPTQTTAAAQAR